MPTSRDRLAEGGQEKNHAKRKKLKFKVKEKAGKRLIR